METIEKTDNMETMINRVVEASGVPKCYICGNRIVGVHIDYINTERIPVKICISCIFKALDYYINVRNKQFNLGNKQFNNLLDPYDPTDDIKYH